EMGEEVPSRLGQLGRNLRSPAACRRRQRLGQQVQDRVVPAEPLQGRRRAGDGEQQSFLVAGLAQDLSTHVRQQRLQLATGPPAVGRHRQQLFGANGYLPQQQAVLVG